MELGWIDFSKEERGKVLDVINLLSEEGTLDELGIAPIRDGFANVFFPGTSTIQTRAKYFLIVPYALADLEHSKVNNPKVLLEQLDSIERLCGEKLIETSNEGIVGSRSLKSGSWVKRTPANIYWNGIRTFGIFTGGSMSLAEYVKASCMLKAQKKTIKEQGNRNEEVDQNDRDDSDAGGILSTSFWKLPFYESDSWRDTLRIGLTAQESRFLKLQIIENCGQTLLAFVLENFREDFAQLASFEDIEETLFPVMPNEMRTDYRLAKAFSDFIYGARIRYNVILSQGLNEAANQAWSGYEPNMGTHAKLDLDSIFARLKVRNPSLYHFLKDIQGNMTKGEVDKLDGRIIKRECQLKTSSRAKLMRVGEVDTNAWIGGGRLDYRFNTAKTIVQDIFDGEVT